MRGILAQTRLELALTLRRGESLLVTIGIPVGILVFFSTVDVLPHPRGPAVDFLLPGVLALSIISSAMVSLGIATGFERQTGVLKRLGITPLGRRGIVAAKALSTGAVVAVQLGAVVGVAILLGWDPAGSVAAAATACALGTLAFAGLGLALAGSLRAETNLAAANGLFLAFLLLGGIVAPVDRLPGVLETVARASPAYALSVALRGALDAAIAAPFAPLALWAVGGLILAGALFHWE